MADILHDFTIRAKRGDVFAALTTPAGLNEWWTKTAPGEPRQGAIYELGFGPGFAWRGRVTEIAPNEVFELQMIKADEEWTDTRVRFELLPGSGVTPVRFRHSGWPTLSDLYRVSCYCWAAYLRILRRYVEYGERVPYEKRIEA
jgi:uncharacterized protein YndB with AHSA1/START domain